MINKNLFSIVMTCYNQERYIEQSIESLVKQSLSDWELIIVDDCSFDRSVKTIKKTINNFEIQNKVKLIRHSENLGCGSSLREAIENSCGHLVGILDADDTLYHKKALRIMQKVHRKYPHAAMTYSNFIECDQQLNPRRKIVSRQLNEGETFLGAKLRISHFKVFKREFYDKTDGVNKDLRQTVDKDLVLKLEEVGKLVYVNDFLYLYRRHSRSLTKSISKKDKEYRVFISTMRKKVYEDAKTRRGIIKNEEKP